MKIIDIKALSALLNNSSILILEKPKERLINLVTVIMHKALVVSKDLRCWHLLDIGYIASDNNEEININQGQVAIANGSSLVIVENNDLLKPFKNGTVMFSYWSLFDQVKGIGFRLKKYFK